MGIGCGFGYLSEKKTARITELGKSSEVKVSFIFNVNKMKIQNSRAQPSTSH